jgi:hypothetical protein
VSDEWEVLADYIDDLASSAPAAVRPTTERVRCEFLAAKAAHDAATALLTDLENAGALMPGAHEVWAVHESEMRRRWRDLLSAAADADMKVRRAIKRKKSSTIDHEADRAVSLRAVLLRIFNTEKDLKAAILDASRDMGVKPSPDEHSYYQRIKRIIQNPMERIETEAVLRLKAALDERQKPSPP